MTPSTDRPSAATAGSWTSIPIRPTGPRECRDAVQ
jgi:hypothetical protein